jgi:hypothetical protein
MSDFNGSSPLWDRLRRHPAVQAGLVYLGRLGAHSGGRRLPARQRRRSLVGPRAGGGLRGRRRRDLVVGDREVAAGG